MFEAQSVGPTAERNRSAFDRALGPLRQYIERPGVYNVNANPDGRIFVEERGRGKYEAPETMSELQREGLIGIIANETKTGPISRLSSRLAFDLPFGYAGRGQAFCAPVGPGWPLMLRNHAAQVIPSSAYTFRRTTRTHRDPIRAATIQEATDEAIRRRWNIMVAGAQNSGKTTKLSSLCADAARIRPDARLVVMQDRDELSIGHRDHLKLFWKIPQKRYDHNGGQVIYSYNSSDLLEDVLRTNADFYVFGELRDPLAAVGLLTASNTGARGIMGTLYRLETMLDLAIGSTSSRAPREMIARFVDLIVYMEYDELTRERWIGDAQQVVGLDGGEWMLANVVF
jgi:Flp pilus assembly CpaF family ATPase